MKKNIKRRVIAIASVILLFSLFGCRLIETNLTAQVKWKFNPKSPAVGHLNLENDSIYIEAGDLYALDKEAGRKKWKFNTNKLSSGPTTNNFINNLLVSEETIYFSAMFFKKGPSTSGVYALDGNTGELLWKFDTGEEEPTDFLEIAANLIYFKRGLNAFYALDKKSGKVEWKIEGPEDIAKKEDIDAVKVTKGEVFLKTAIPSTELGKYSNNLYALDAQTGEKKWLFTVEETTENPLNFLAVADGLAFLEVGKEGGLSEIYAVDTSSGREKWRFPLGSLYNNPTIAKETVYVDSETRDGQTQVVYALDVETGKERWRFEEKEVLAIQAITDNTAYIKVQGIKGEILYALDVKTGQKKWQFKAGKYNEFTNEEFTKDAAYLTVDGSVYALDAQTGKQKWKFETGGFTIRGVSLVDKVIYISSAAKSPGKPDWLDGTLHAVNIGTGQEKWRYETGKGKGEGIKLDLLIVSERTFYFATGGDTLDEETQNPPLIGNVYAIQPKE